MRNLRILAVSVCAGLLAVVIVMTTARAEEAPQVSGVFSESVVAGGLEEPTAMAFAPDGRLFVAQRTGALRVVESGGLQERLVLKVNPSPGKERGLIGVAVDPNFGRNGYVYIHYTARKPKVQNRISRYTVSRNDSGDTVVEGGSKKNIFKLNRLKNDRHNGGAIHFGEDKRLYIAVGDNVRPEKAQKLGNLFGKMLRIKKNGAIPKKNPFYKKAKKRNRAIWARGLRNPYTFAVQPGTGRIYINDVGAREWEEINLGRKGANYGWPFYEGPEKARRYASPVFAYRHGKTNTTGCAISGGDFYNPAENTFGAEYEGDYFFADFCNGWIRRYDPATDRASSFATVPSRGPVDLRVSDDGDLYYLYNDTATGAGSVRKISKN